ncbi:MAG: hypothetical protein ABWU13_25735, partial [Limnospira maxima]
QGVAPRRHHPVILTELPIKSEGWMDFCQKLARGVVAMVVFDVVSGYLALWQGCGVFCYFCQ